LFVVSPAGDRRQPPVHHETKSPSHNKATD
jgi:hypothetical protein